MISDFKEGDRVYRMQGRRGPYYEVFTVFKVYKNGNVIFEKGGTQHQAYAWDLLTEEKLAELEANKVQFDRNVEFSLAVEKLDRLTRHGRKNVTRDQFERLREFVAEFDGETKG